MPCEEEDTCMPYEEEDTCMPCEEEDTCMPRLLRGATHIRSASLCWTPASDGAHKKKPFKKKTELLKRDIQMSEYHSIPYIRYTYSQKKRKKKKKRERDRDIRVQNTPYIRCTYIQESVSLFFLFPNKRKKRDTDIRVPQHTLHPADSEKYSIYSKRKRRKNNFSI